MAFVTRLMKTPAVLMLTLAMLCSVCVVGCSQAEDAGGGAAGGDTEAPADAEGGSGAGGDSEGESAE